jgi:ASCH domain
MNLYVQYHNVAQEGLPLSDPPFRETRLGVHTRRSHVKDAEGCVFLIAGIGTPRRYLLWETVEVEEVREDDNGEFEAWGTGWQLAPPQVLKGKAFEAFRSACANVVGFRRVNDLAYSRTLLKLAEAHRLPAKNEDTLKFVKTLLGLLRGDDPNRGVVLDLLAKLEPMRALSIRQPHAEAILRGIKRIEYRSGPTKVRGRVLIYAGLGRYPAADEAEMLREYGIRDAACDDLPRGVLVGTVDLYDCDDGEWHVRDPQRASKLVKPKNQPQPVWFNPF